MLMTFGKYKGIHVELIPNGYLWWLYGIDSLKPQLAQVVRNEVIRRWPEKFQVPARQIFGRGTVRAAVTSIFRELATVYHPDHGGNTEAMKALNEFRDRLLLVVG